jgi:DNA-3-methyladenine glycosylase II
MEENISGIIYMNRNTFFLKPVPPFRLDLTVWALRRRPENLVDRWDGQTYRRAFSLPAGLVEVSVTQNESPETPQLQVMVESQPFNSNIKIAVTAALERLLGLQIDLSKFYQFATAQHEQMRLLINTYRGMKPPQFVTVFESLINAIASQQVSRTVGIHFVNQLIVNYGFPISNENATVHTFPSFQVLAKCNLNDLQRIGFSSQKSRAIIELTQSIITDALNFESITQMSDEEATEQLCNLRGIGKWSADYVLLRGLGRIHIFPGGIVGVRNNLQQWLHLKNLLDDTAAKKTLDSWHPYGGLIYFHLLLDRLAAAGHL